LVQEHLITSFQVHRNIVNFRGVNLIPRHCVSATTKVAADLFHLM